MHARKVVLVTGAAYSQGLGESLLRQLIERKIELFCVVGVDAEAWEDALDWLCIGSDGEASHPITTTAHPHESVEEVISFAESFHYQGGPAVEVMYF